jgi:hypothetical protein
MPNTNEEKTPLSEILKFIENLKTMRVGNDLVTDSSVKTRDNGAPKTS